jgi:hypothetical protein
MHIDDMPQVATHKTSKEDMEDLRICNYPPRKEISCSSLLCAMK